MKMKIVFWILCVALMKNEAARILAMFPIASISHQVVFRAFTQELARRGHDVTVITTDPAFPKGEAPPNLTEIDLHDVSYDTWRESYVNQPKGHRSDLASQVQLSINLISTIFFAQMATSEVQELIHGKKFDLVFAENCVRPTLVLSHVFKAPLISISSFGAFVGGSYGEIGASTHLILFPIVPSERIYNITFEEKIKQLYNYYSFEKYFKVHDEYDHQMFKRYFGNDTPPYSELRNNIAMLFLNVHPIFEGNVPVPPSVIHIWGMYQRPQKELPQDLKSYLNSSKHGVIYMSFGTNTEPANLPPKTIQMFIRVLSQLPYDVLFKWNKDELPVKSPNIRFEKWFPQAELLRHPKIKLFITQGGLTSTDEAITAGVPLVGIPMLGDQWYNTEKYVHLKIGVQLDVDSVTEEEFRNAIVKVIGDESYKTNIKKLNALMRDQPMQPLERAVWWTEHVLRHGGGAHLRAPAANISWAEYYELEFVSILLLGLSIGVLTLYSVYRFVARNYYANVKLNKRSKYVCFMN